MEMLVYDEEKLNESYEIMEEIKHDLYDVDSLLYNAVMKVAYAKGMEYVEYENKTIDMRVPEQLMIQCRDTTSMISEKLKTQINEISQYSKQEASTIQDTGDAIIQARKVTSGTKTGGIVNHKPPTTVYGSEENNANEQTKTEPDQLKTSIPEINNQETMIPETGIGKETSIDDYTTPIIAGLAAGVGGLITEKIKNKKDEKKEDKKAEI